MDSNKPQITLGQQSQNYQGLDTKYTSDHGEVSCSIYHSAAFDHLTVPCAAHPDPTRLTLGPAWVVDSDDQLSETILSCFPGGAPHLQRSVTCLLIAVAPGGGGEGGAWNP